MSIGNIVDQLTGVTRIEPLTNHVGNLPAPERAMCFCGLVLIAAFLGACEQGVANAEQPPGVAALEASDPSKQGSAAMVQSGRAKLVFDKAACELPNKGAELTSECSVIGRVSPDRKGHLTYGPYLRLAAGEYEFEMEYRSSADAAIAAGRWDVTARIAAEEQVIANGDMLGTANKVKVLTGRFSMPPNHGGVPVIEIRAAPSHTAETEVKRLRIYEVQPGR